MVTVEFEHEIHDEVVISDTGGHGVVTAYFVGSMGVQYMVDYFDAGDRKLTTYFHPFQLKAGYKVNKKEVKV